MKRRFSLIKISKADAEKCDQLYTPKFSSDIDISRKFKEGQELACSARTSDLRNVGFNRKYFALLKLAFENLPEKYHGMFKNIEELRTEIKLQIGCRERRESLGGQVYYVPKSIAFDKMGAEEFEEVYSKTIDFILKHILPGVESKDIDEEILNFL